LWLTLLLLLLPLQAWLLLDQLAQADASGRFSRKALPHQVERLGEVLNHPLVKAWLDVNMASLTPSKVRQHGTASGGQVWVATRIVCCILRISVLCTAHRCSVRMLSAAGSGRAPAAAADCEQVQLVS
jgi:hypothetical protein